MLRIFLIIFTICAPLSGAVKRRKLVALKPGRTLSLFGSSRAQISESKNYFKNFKRQDDRSSKVGGGVTLGYQFLSDLKTRQLFSEFSIKRISLNESRNKSLKIKDTILEAGGRIDTQILVFPLSFKFGYSFHRLTSDHSEDQSDNGLYYGMGLSIGFRNIFDIFFDITNYQIRYNSRKIHLSNYDLGVRYYF